MGEGDAATVTLPAWFDALRDALGATDALALTPREQAALLDLARVAAHTSQRVAAPLSTFLVGVALHALPPGDERERRIRDLTASLERDVAGG